MKYEKKEDLEMWYVPGPLNTGRGVVIRRNSNLDLIMDLCVDQEAAIEVEDTVYYQMLNSFGLAFRHNTFTNICQPEEKIFYKLYIDSEMIFLVKFEGKIYYLQNNKTYIEKYLNLGETDFRKALRPVTYEDIILFNEYFSKRGYIYNNMSKKVHNIVVPHKGNIYVVYTTGQTPVIFFKEDDKSFYGTSVFVSWTNKKKAEAPKVENITSIKIASPTAEQCYKQVLLNNNLKIGQNKIESLYDSAPYTSALIKLYTQIRVEASVLNASNFDPISPGEKFFIALAQDFEGDIYFEVKSHTRVCYPELTYFDNIANAKAVCKKYQKLLIWSIKDIEKLKNHYDI